MIEPKHGKLSITRQCALLDKSRSWYYYHPHRDPTKAAEDQYHTELIRQASNAIPFYGYRKIALEVTERFGVPLSFKQTLRIRQELGLRAVRLPPPISTPRTAHAVYPYLLTEKEITHVNQVWQVDITYVRLPAGTVYLCTILDVYSRKVLAWNLSNTMDILFVLYLLTLALQRYGAPEIINTDQGSQFTTEDWISMVEDLAIRVSMDGRGRATDNIYIERWWRSFKYEDLYFNQYETMQKLHAGIAAYVEFYNTRRFHQALDYRRPDEVFNEADLTEEMAS